MVPYRVSPESNPIEDAFFSKSKNRVKAGCDNHAVSRLSVIVKTALEESGY